MYEWRQPKKHGRGAHKCNPGIKFKVGDTSSIDNHPRVMLFHKDAHGWYILCRCTSAFGQKSIFYKRINGVFAKPAWAIVVDDNAAKAMCVEEMCDRVAHDKSIPCICRVYFCVTNARLLLEWFERHATIFWLKECNREWIYFAQFESRTECHFVFEF